MNKKRMKELNYEQIAVTYPTQIIFKNVPTALYISQIICKLHKIWIHTDLIILIYKTRVQLSTVNCTI